jgi:hypothetical protein
VIEKTLDEGASSRADAQDVPDVDPSGDCRALLVWLEQLATALRGSCSSRRADALAAIDLFDQDAR